MTPLAFAKDYITRWEGGLSLDADDNGNWSGGKKGVGALVGSNRGVTAQALASFRGVPVSAITKQMMAALSLDEAGQIALKIYYYGPKLDKLPWNQWTASIFDAGWGMGPKQAIKLLQRQIGVADDGLLGPMTIAAASAYLARHGLEACAWEWAFIRARFYASLKQYQYLTGWLNRTAYFTPNDAEGWWGRFAA